MGTLFGTAYVNDHVDHKTTHVQREKLFDALLKDSPQSRTHAGPCAMTSYFEDLVSTTATKGRTKRVIVVAGTQPADVPPQMTVLATFVHIPFTEFGDALFPIMIPTVTSVRGPTEIVWS